jgi:carbonic anhydrase
MAMRCKGTSENGVRCKRRMRGKTLCVDHDDEKKIKSGSQDTGVSCARSTHVDLGKTVGSAKKKSDIGASGSGDSGASGSSGDNTSKEEEGEVKREENRKFADRIVECRVTLPSEAQRVVDQLMDGNRLFRESRTYHVQRLRTADAHKPSFLIVSCSDSRTDPALVFAHLEIGRLFQVRTAGHTISAIEMESIKYAVRQLGPMLLVVLAHTRCGAVTAAYNVTTEPHANQETRDKYPLIVAEIEPAVRIVFGAQDESKLALSPRVASSPQKSREWWIDECAREHAILTARRIYTACDATISVIPMIYDVTSGRVRICCELLVAVTTEHKVRDTTSRRHRTRT